MNTKFYQLKKLPDLTLAKYAAQAENGVGGIVGLFPSFLATLHRLSYVYELKIHLIYQNSKDKTNFYLGFSSHNNLSVIPIDSLIETSLIAPYFQFEEVEVDLLNSTASEGIQVIKKEQFLDAIPQEGFPPFYHLVSRWENSEDARLYSLIRLMESLPSDTAFSFTVKAKDVADKVREVLNKTLVPLREINGGMIKSMVSKDIQTRPRDPNAEIALKEYEELISAMDSTPHASVAIQFWSKEKKYSELLAQMALSEALEKGSYELVSVNSDSFIPIDKLPILHHQKTPTPTRYFLPTLFTMDEVESFFRFPVLHEAEIISFPKETDPVIEEGGHKIGMLQSLNKPLLLPIQNLTKHALVVGVPGSGKTNTLMQLAYNLYKNNGVPFLILEPAKREYRGLLNLSSDISLFTPGRNSTQSKDNPLRLEINPFEFPKGYPLEEHINNLMAVFEGAFPIFAPLPALIERALITIYNSYGWENNAINNGNMTYPKMDEFVKALQNEVDKVDYGEELKGNLKAALSMRFERLTQRALGDVFNVRESTFQPEEWLEYPVIIELESLGSNNANFLTLLLLTLIRETLTLSAQKELRHMLFIEEAHNIIAHTAISDNEDGNPKVASTAYIVKLLAEVRALGQGIVIADQLPTALAPEVVKNTSLKICHRLVAPDDRAEIGQAMSASDMQMEAVSSMMPGEVLINFEGLLKPFYAKIEPVDNDFVHLETLSDLEIIKKINS
jgi:DNA helicase HerA-like ATPase